MMHDNQTAIQPRKEDDWFSEFDRVMKRVDALLADLGGEQTPSQEQDGERRSDSTPDTQPDGETPPSVEPEPRIP